MNVKAASIILAAATPTIGAAYWGESIIQVPSVAPILVGAAGTSLSYFSLRRPLLSIAAITAATAGAIIPLITTLHPTIPKKGMENEPNLVVAGAALALVALSSNLLGRAQNGQSLFFPGAAAATVVAASALINGATRFASTFGLAASAACTYLFNSR